MKHLIQNAATVDATVLALWKAFKYSSIKASVFSNAQEAEGFEKLKLLKASLIRWLSHGAATIHIINRFEPIINSLDEIIHNKNNPKLMGICTQLLEPNNVLFLLLLADVLQPVNRFSMFLQTRNLVFNSVNAKLNQLMESLRDISENEGPYFKKNAESFLHTVYNRLTFARRIRDSALPGDNIDKTIREFKAKIKKPFFNALLTEISNAINIADKEVIAFDVFNTVDNHETIIQTGITCKKIPL